MYAIIVNDVVKKFNNRIALNNINLKIKKGMVYSLLGPNGAGKTTLLNIIAGLLKPDHGRVLINETLEPHSIEAKKILSYCPQEPALYDKMTGLENIMFYARLYGLNDREAYRRAKELLELVGLWREANKLVGKYSGGMKKRLNIAISLINDPEILLLDEPTTGLDPIVRRTIWDLIEKLKIEGKTIVLATHYMEEADALSNKVAIINEGKVIVEGTPRELKEKYGPKSVVSIEVEKPLLEQERLRSVLKDFSTTVYISNNNINIHIDEPDKYVPSIVNKLYSIGYNLLSLKITKPTLEDVFIRLTGRRLE